MMSEWRVLLDFGVLGVTIPSPHMTSYMTPKSHALCLCGILAVESI